MEVVRFVAKRLGISHEQAEGGAGAVYQLVQQRLSDDEFVQVAYATPAVSDLMLKAPPLLTTSGGDLVNAISRWVGGLGSLRPLRKPFAELGLGPEKIRPFTTEVLAYARQQERPDAVALLERALK